MNTLTIIVCAYLAVAMLRGALRGFSRTVYSMLFLILVVIATLALTPLVSRVIAGSQYVQTFFTEKSDQFLSTYVNSSGTVDLSSLSIAGQSIRESPFRAAAAILGILLSASGVTSLVSEKLVSFMIGVTATVATFIIVFLVILLLRILFGRRPRRKAVSALDHLFGIPIGLVRGLIVVWGVLGLINLLAFLPAASGAATQVAASPMLSWLNSHNLLVRFMTAVIAGMLR